MQLLDSIIVVSIPACHAEDRGSIPRRGGIFSLYQQVINEFKVGHTPNGRSTRKD